jgi:O-methyltransferase
MLKHTIRHSLNRLGYDLVNRRAPAQVEFDVDEAFYLLYERAQDKCQMTSTDNLLRRQRHYTLQHLIGTAPLAQGDVCELGCWRGLSAYQLASKIAGKVENPVLHIFDSFEGLSEYTDDDIPVDNAQNLNERRKHFACPLETVQANLREFPFVRYHKGWIPDRFAEVADRRFSFVHVDVDLYQPIGDAFRFFYPRLVSRGVMVFDDYGFLQFPGAKKAVDECLEQAGSPFFLPLPSGQAFVLKP